MSGRIDFVLSSDVFCRQKRHAGDFRRLVDRQTAEIQAKSRIRESRIAGLPQPTSTLNGFVAERTRVRGIACQRPLADAEFMLSQNNRRPAGVSSARQWSRYNLIQVGPVACRVL